MQHLKSPLVMAFLPYSSSHGNSEAASLGHSLCLGKWALLLGQDYLQGHR